MPSCIISVNYFLALLFLHPIKRITCFPFFYFLFARIEVALLQAPANKRLVHKQNEADYLCENCHISISCN